MLRLRYSFFVVFGVLGCGDDSGNSASEARVLLNLDRGAVLSRTADFLSASYSELAVRAKTLDESLTALCSSTYGSEAAASSIMTAKEKWRDLAAEWHKVDAIAVGPLAANAETLRYDIYSWPLVNPCAVDREVANAKEQGQSYVLSDRDPSKGLDAVEYLLFDSDLDHACSAAVSETASWNTLPEAERFAARCDYQKLLLLNLNSDIETLGQSWQDDYASTWKSLDGDQSEQDRLNELTDGLFFIDSTVKDQKLGTPLAIYSNCQSFPCLESVEHLSSGHSGSAVSANLKGFSEIYGKVDENSGFAALISEAGEEEYARELEAKVNAAVAASTDLEDSSFVDLLADQTACDLELSVEEQVSLLCKSYQTLKQVTDELKGKFLAVLQLQLPKQSTGDND